MSKARHRAPDSPSDVTTKRGEPRRGPKPGEKPRRKPSYRRVPVEVHEAPSGILGGSRAHSDSPAYRPPAREGGGRRERAQAVSHAAQSYADRSAMRQTWQGGKPSVSGRALSGAGAGAASGAALGSVVPGVGTAVGAGAGAVVGGVGGGVAGSKAKKAYKQATAPNGRAKRILVAEFTLCMLVVALSPMTDRRREESGRAFMRRMAALMGTFFFLALVSAIGPRAANAAAGLGGLVAVVLLVSDRDLFVRIASQFNNTHSLGQTVGTGPPPGAGD